MLYEFTSRNYKPLGDYSEINPKLVCVNANTAEEACFIIHECGILSDDILCIGTVEETVDWINTFRLEAMKLPLTTTGFWRGNDFIQVNTRKFKLEQFIGPK